MSEEYTSYTSALLTDFYQITISLAQWKQGRHNEHCVFYLFYRTQPFQGSFAFFGGLNESMNFLKKFKFTEPQLEYIQANLPNPEPEFIDYLRNLDPKLLTIWAPKEGSVVFPREPLLRVEGPMVLCQLIETPLLNCINFATLLTTNASRIRLLSGKRILMEFGLRRAQGPDGAVTASRYSYLGGFDSTSNVLAGYKFGIPIAGTVAHSFVSSYYSTDLLKTTTIPHLTTNEPIDLLHYANIYLNDFNHHSNKTELTAFIAQAQAFPKNFLALVDTYDTLTSGVPNFLAVALGLHHAGYRAKGIRLDSGDLPYLSKKSRQLYREFSEKYNIDYAANFGITASNDINEKSLLEFEHIGHEMTAYGIGTHLVTCQKQPALGGVYKLVEVNGRARVKLSNDLIKVTLPARKELYRLLDINNKPICDVLTIQGEILEPGKIDLIEVSPATGEFQVEFAKAIPMYNIVMQNGEIFVDELKVGRERVLNSLNGGFRDDVIKIDHPNQYIVSISKKLHETLLNLIKEAQE